MKPLIFFSCALATTFFMCAQSGADEIDDRWYIAPALSFIKADNDRKADNGPGLSLGVGKVINNWWNIEANVVGDELDGKDGLARYKQIGIGLDALLFFKRDPAFSPYAVIGGGALSSKRVGESTNAMANIGLGFKKDLTDNGVSVRADIRYRADFDDYSVSNQKNFGDWLLNVGLVIPLGDKAKPAPVTEAAPPAPAVVAPPVVAAVEPPVKPIDSDGDGVPDSEDRCPNTPAGAKVDAHGCELDSDGDGVVDSKDLCPNTKPGAKVDSNGCEIPEVIILKGVNFETSSDRLTSDSTAILDGVADTLKSHPETAVEVAGYTDSRGSASLNERLSQKRAESVVKFLVDHGVNAENLTAKGYGKGNPIADNKTAEGRAMNRRVELHITRK